MCLVHVFIFFKKAEHMYEKLIFLIWTKIKLYPFVAFHLTKPLHSKISIDASEHPRLGWASQSSVYVRRSSPRLSLIRCWPSTPRSKFESGFHLLCQWVLVFVFCFCFSSPIGKTHFSCSLFAVERWVSFFISGVRVGWVLRHEGEHREERRDEMEERRQN